MTDNNTIKQKFRSSIKRGTGAAHLIMQANPAMDFSADIIKASLTNWAYDAQSEGSRALYVSELILLSKQQAKIRKAILKGLETERRDTWALVQLFDLATIFAKQGDIEARQAIYGRFYNDPIEHSDWCGYDSIIEMDGLKGLIYIASTIGKGLEKKPDDWQDSWIITHFQQNNPKIKVWQQLEKASKEDPFIRIYLKRIKQTENGRKDHQRPVINYKTVTERIESKSVFPLFPYQAKQLSKTDIKKLADDFLKETNRKKLEKYMMVFSKVKYPYNYKPILEIAMGRNLKSDRLVEYATIALKCFAGNDIRQFANDSLKNTKLPVDFLNLLVANYKKGDSKLLATIVKNCKDKHTIHGIVLAYLNIYEANKTSECKEPLEAVYEKLACGMCRNSIIKILINNKALSKQIREEIKYDSYAKTRQL